jgi:general stress protein 26
MTTRRKRNGVPAAQRPSLSGYVQVGKLLAWSWVDARMAKATNYWITTVSTGMPSSRPVWGIWLAPTLLFGSGSKVARNIDADPRVQVNLESGDEVVMIEGRARRLRDRAQIKTYVARYRDKYNWDIAEDDPDLFIVEPLRALAWIVDGTGLDGGAAFSNSATEWRFDSSANERSRERKTRSRRR